MQEAEPSGLSATAGEAASQAEGLRPRLGPPSPWLYIALIGPLYFLVGGVVQALQLPLGLLWDQAFLFVWPSLLWLSRAGFRPIAFTRLNRVPSRRWLIPLIALMAFLCASAMMAVFETLAPPEWVKTFDETQVLSSVTGPWTAVLFFGVIVGAPIAEELVFRGCLLPMLAERMRLGWALVLQAALFSLIHADPIGFLPRFVLGLTFGMLWIYTGSLWSGIFAHALNNAISALIFFFVGPEANPTGEVWIGVAAASAAAAVLALLLFLLRRNARPAPLPSDDPQAPAPIRGLSLFEDVRVYAGVALLSLGVVALAGRLH